MSACTNMHAYMLEYIAGWLEVAVCCSVAPFSKFDNMETPSLPSNASGSLPAFIWRMSRTNLI